MTEPREPTRVRHLQPGQQFRLKRTGDLYESPPLRINPGDRVAQASLVPAPRVTFTVVEQMSLTERGAGGFGSTGL